MRYKKEAESDTLKFSFHRAGRKEANEKQRARKRQHICVPRFKFSVTDAYAHPKPTSEKSFQS
jgi:hypothetical protein